MEKTKKEKKIARIALLTPYLYMSLDELKKEFSESWAKTQLEKYGLEKKNLSGYDGFSTARHRVAIEKRGEPFSGIRPHLAINGCTETAEDEVRSLRGSGIIMARYSIFYGGPSEYTGHMPEDSGYALDIPKSVNSVKKLLTNDRFLEGIIRRDEKKLVEAVKCINSKLDQPILVTPYLSVALKYQLSR